MMGVLGAEGVVVCLRTEKIQVGCHKGMIEGELDSRRGRLTVKMGEGAFVKGGWFAVGADDGLPISGVSTQEVECVLPVAKELGFGCDKRGRREWEDDELLFLQKGVDPSHAWESRPLDGVPIGVSMVARIGREEGGK